MDIHWPEGPVRSVKDFVIHPSMITLGILIAPAQCGAQRAFEEQQSRLEAVWFELTGVQDEPASDGRRSACRHHEVTSRPGPHAFVEATRAKRHHRVRRGAPGGSVGEQLAREVVLHFDGAK
jgi:hypothetical protein